MSEHTAANGCDSKYLVVTCARPNKDTSILQKDKIMTTTFCVCEPFLHSQSHHKKGFFPARFPNMNLSEKYQDM